MKDMTPRQLNGLFLCGLAVLLFLAPSALRSMFEGQYLALAAIDFLPVVGIIFIAIGIYRVFGVQKDHP